MGLPSRLSSWPRSILIASVAVLICSAAISYQVFFAPPPVYKPIPVSSKTLGLEPVAALQQQVDNHHWHLLTQNFAEEKATSTFQDFFGLGAVAGLPGGYLELHRLRLERVEGYPQSRGDFPDYEVTAHFTYAGTTYPLQFRTEYDAYGSRYLITQVSYPSALQFDTDQQRIAVPQITDGDCPQLTQGQNFTYLRPPVRIEGQTYPAKFLSSTLEPRRRSVIEDFPSAQALTQVPFEPWETEAGTLEPGWVLSDSDAAPFELNPVFLEIQDGAGTFQISNEYYPVSVFLDRGFNMVQIFTANGERILYGNDGDEDEYPCDEAIAVEIIGDYAYILDLKNGGKVVVLHLYLQGGLLQVEEVGVTDFGLAHMNGVGDLAGFATEDENVLYLLDMYTGQLHQVPIDPKTGLKKAGRDIESHHQFTRHSKIVATPLNSATGESTLMLYNYGGQWIETYSHKAFTGGITPLFKTKTRGKISSLGYNRGNNTFLVTDELEQRIYVFSGQGYFLGAAGMYGKGERNEELYRPNLVSANFTATDAKELIVASRWSHNTGFKRFFPRADVGEISVIEQANNDINRVAESELLFRYVLTAGYQATGIELSLNGEPIWTSSQPQDLQPNVFTKGFTVSALPALQSGWNEYTVTLTGQLQGGQNANLSFTRQRTIEFYYTPSILHQGLTLTSANGHSVKEPFIIYKSTILAGPDTSRIEGGALELMPNCTLRVAGDHVLWMEDEAVTLGCGSHIELVAASDTLKHLQGVTFDGSFRNQKMVSVWGAYTGGQGSGSAPSSMVRFVDCEFRNFAGIAAQIVEGRATFVNPKFEGRDGRIEVGIVANPNTRLDVLGGNFAGLDIGIEAHEATVYAGHARQTFLDEFPIQPLTFKDNYLGIYGLGGFLNLSHARMENQEVGILSLDGTLDLARNQENTFQNHEMAVVFSGVLEAETGKNRFVDNVTDLIYLQPESNTAPYTFDITCNYWQHGDISGSPAVAILRDSVAEPTPPGQFVYVPYLVARGNGNYTCTGRKVPPGTPEQTIQSPPATTALQRGLSQVRGSRSPQASFGGWQQQVQSQSSTGLLPFGQYPTDLPLGELYQQAVFKQSLLSLLWHPEPAQGAGQIRTEAMNRVGADGERLGNSVLDKKMFIRALRYQNVPQRVVVPTQTLNIPPTLTLFPNPTNGSFSVGFTIEEEGPYEISLINAQGSVQSQLLRETELTVGSREITFNLPELPTGLYFVVLRGKSIRVTKSLAIQ